MMKSVGLILYSVLLVSSATVNHQWPDTPSHSDNGFPESQPSLTQASTFDSWLQSKVQRKDGTLEADVSSPLLAKCGKNKYRCLHSFPLPLLQHLGQNVGDEKWLELVGIHLPALLTVTTSSQLHVTPVSNYVRLPARRAPNRPLNLTALHIKHGILHSAEQLPTTIPTSRPIAFTTIPARSTVRTPTTSTESVVHVTPPTMPMIIKLDQQKNPTLSATPTFTVQKPSTSSTIHSSPADTKLGSHNSHVFFAKPIFPKPSQQIQPSIVLQNSFETAVTTSQAALTQSGGSPTHFLEEKTPPSRTTRNTPKTTPKTVHRTQKPFLPTQPPQTNNPTFSDPNLPVSPTTDIQTVQHALVFKMLLLIAFVAVPILAAAAPILFPAGRTGRKLEDEAVMDWAAETATMLSLAHLVMDERITKLLQLGDEEFASTLSAALTESVGEVNGLTQEDLKDATRHLKTVFVDLLAMVKDKTKLKQFQASSVEDNPSTEKDDLITLPVEDNPSTEKDDLITLPVEDKPSTVKETVAPEKDQVTMNWNTINVKHKLWNY